MGLLVRLARPEDAAALARLFYETVHAVNSRDYGPEQIAAWAPSLLSPEEWRARQGDKLVYVAVDGGLPVGFVELEPGGHIDCFYVHKDRLRQGVGTRLMAEVEAVALPMGISRLFTEVSLTAQPFFLRRGFTLVQEQEVKRRGVRLRNALMERWLL